MMVAAIERFLEAAATAGCPADQVRRFRVAGYAPQPRQLEFHAAARACDEPGGPTQVGVGGARGTVAGSKLQKKKSDQ